MNDTIVPTNQARSSRSRWPRRLSLLAAALVGVTLVGSLLFVLTAMHGKTPGTTATAGQTSTSASAPALTIPANCRDQHDLADELLCAQHEEATLNATKTLAVHVYSPSGAANGSGTVNVTFLRAYADTTRLMLVYNISQAPKGDWGGFRTLNTKQGQLNSNSGNFSGFTVQSFDTSTLPAGTTQIQVQSISTYYGAALPLTFTVPLNTASKVIRVKQTSSSKGYSLTLDHVVLTGCTATLYLNAAFPALNKQEGASLIEVQALTLNGQSQPLIASDWRLANHQAATLHLGLPLLNQHSGWTITMALVKMPLGSSNMKDRVLMTATFTFAV